MTLQDVQNRLNEIGANTGSDIALFQEQVNALAKQIGEHLAKSAHEGQTMAEGHHSS